jgi:hypothetical protein
MLQSKDINKIAELKNDFTHEWVEPDFIFRTNGTNGVRNQFLVNSS